MSLVSKPLQEGTKIRALSEKESGVRFLFSSAFHFRARAFALMLWNVDGCCFSNSCVEGTLELQGAQSSSHTHTHCGKARDFHKRRFYRVKPIHYFPLQKTSMVLISLNSTALTFSCKDRMWRTKLTNFQRFLCLEMRLFDRADQENSRDPWQQSRDFGMQALRMVWRSLWDDREMLTPKPQRGAGTLGNACIPQEGRQI